MQISGERRMIFCTGNQKLQKITHIVFDVLGFDHINIYRYFKYRKIEKFLIELKKKSRKYKNC